MRNGTGLFDLDEFTEAEELLGRPIGYTVQFTDRGSAREMGASAFGLLADSEATLPALSDRIALSLTVPLGFGNANPRTSAGLARVRANLVATARGDQDARYLQVAERAVEGGFPDAIIRLGHEFNGEWPPYSSRGNELAFIAAFRHVRNLFAAVSPDFRFDWNAMRLDWSTAPAAWPGDEYVDIVSMDIYWRVDPGQPSWRQGAWERQYLAVLQSHRDFAIAHGKPVAYPEWAVEGADAPEFIDEM